MRILATLSCLAFGLPAAAPLAAHEFWIEPLDYQVGPDEPIVGHLVNGQFFEGTQLAYVPQRFTNFLHVAGDAFGKVESPIGTFPGLQALPLEEGLNVFAYRSTADEVDYETMDKFQSFADHKDFVGWAEAHRARGLPEEDFTELYTRFAKTLVAVGDGAGSDAPIGLETELVALDNPYTDDMGGGIRVLSLYRGQPRTGAQIELFEKAPDGTVEITLHRTDAAGIAVLPVKPGHSYLVDAVVLREPSAAMQTRRGVVWETLWASLTFAVPG